MYKVLLVLGRRTGAHREDCSYTQTVEPWLLTLGFFKVKINNNKKTQLGATVP